MKEVVRVLERPMRAACRDPRSITHKFNIAGHEGYLTVGLYEDGQPGELFITMAKEGSTIGGLMDSLGTAVSVARNMACRSRAWAQFTHQRFEPAGMTTNRDIPFAEPRRLHLPLDGHGVHPRLPQKTRPARRRARQF